MEFFVRILPELLIMASILGLLYALWVYISQWMGEVNVKAIHAEHLLFIAAMAGFVMISIIVKPDDSGVSHDAPYWLYIATFVSVTLAGITHVIRILNDTKDDNQLTR